MFWKAFRKTTLIALIGVSVVAWSFREASADDLHLKLTSAGPAFSIQNVGDQEITVLDVTINNREECSLAEQQFAVSVKSPALGDKIYLSNSGEPTARAASNEEFHHRWVNAPFGSAKNSTPKVGDAAEWLLSCYTSLVSISVRRIKALKDITFASNSRPR
jgi:hypothetical protein